MNIGLEPGDVEKTGQIPPGTKITLTGYIHRNNSNGSTTVTFVDPTDPRRAPVQWAVTDNTPAQVTDYPPHPQLAEHQYNAVRRHHG